MIGDPHPNWKAFREYERLVPLIDLALGADQWELVSIMHGEDLCEARPLPTGRTGGVLVRLIGERAYYMSLDFWDLRV